MNKFKLINRRYFLAIWNSSQTIEGCGTVFRRTVELNGWMFLKMKLDKLLYVVVLDDCLLQHGAEIQKVDAVVSSPLCNLRECNVNPWGWTSVLWNEDCECQGQEQDGHGSFLTNQKQIIAHWRLALLHTTRSIHWHWCKQAANLSREFSLRNMFRYYFATAFYCLGCCLLNANDNWINASRASRSLCYHFS